jgi:hypothetical protein
MKNLITTLFLAGTITCAIGQQKTAPVKQTDFKKQIENQVIMPADSLTSIILKSLLLQGQRKSPSTSEFYSRMPVAVLKKQDNIPVYRSSINDRMPIKGEHAAAGVALMPDLTIPEPKVTLPEIRVPEVK